MRATILVVPAGFALAASCILPAATLVETGGNGGTGGSGTASTSGTGGTTGVAPPKPANQLKVPIDTPPPSVVAPSGNPGQRHLIHTPGRWWVFYLDLGLVKARSTGDAVPGALWAGVQTFPFDSGVLGSIDGRGLGVDALDTGSEVVVHFSLSSANTATPISHTRGTISSSGLLVAPVPQATFGPNDSPSHAGDGTVTSIGSDGTVADFTSAPNKLCDACAIVFPTVDTGQASWTSGAAAAAKLDKLTSFDPIWMRSTMALQSSNYTFWRQKGTIYMAGQASGTPWGTGEPQSVAGPGDDTRTFATCVQPQSLGRVLHWDSAGFTYLTVKDDGNPIPESPPPMLEDLRELFVSCGPHRVHAFAIAGSGSNTIQGASWDTSRGWSGWAPVVDGAAAKVSRCFLTGFDRVAGPNKDEVGLAWSEGSCGVAGPTSLFAAFVKVVDG
jgi:hypothetical protein